MRLVSLEAFLEFAHLPLLLPPEYRVILFIFMNFTVSMEVCYSSHMHVLLWNC